VRIPVDLHPRKAIGDGRRRRRDAAFTRELTDAQQQTPRAIVRHEEANAPLSIQLNQFLQAGDGGALAGARLDIVEHASIAPGQYMKEQEFEIAVAIAFSGKHRLPP
jgi:hypothetical protein